MTENQEKELFLILGRLVNGVNVLQTDVKDIKVTLAEHSQILAEHSQTLAEHSRQLGENRGLLDHLVSKTDSIAMQVLKNDARLSERLTTVEGAVEDLGGKTH
jgi:uncharacterized coiled-coil protein SlyX